MKVAFDAHVFLEEEKTGIGWYAYNVLEEIGKESYEFEFNCFCSGKDNKNLKNFINYLSSKKINYAINYCNLINISLYRIISTFFPLSYSTLFKSRADVYFFFNYVVPPGVKGKKITMIHDMTYKVYPKTQRLKSRMWLEFSMKKTCKRADYIVTSSDFSKSEIIRYLGVDEKKIKVISCGVNTTIYHDRYTNEQIESVKQKYRISGEYYLYVGTLEPRKNIERLLEAYKQVLNRKTNAPVLVLVGKKGWLYGKIFDLIKQLGLNERIIMTGYVDNVDVPVLMMGAKVFVYPSLYEGFGMPPLEAMACRTAVLSSNVASLPEVVGDAGVLVDPTSIEEIRDGILYLENNDSERERLATLGYERSKKFKWEEVWKNINNILLEI